MRKIIVLVVATVLLFGSFVNANAQTSGSLTEFVPIAAYHWRGSVLEPNAFQFAGSDKACDGDICTVQYDTGGEAKLRRLKVEGLSQFQWMMKSESSSSDEIPQWARDLFAKSMLNLSRKQVAGRNEWEVVVRDTGKINALAFMEMGKDLPIHWERWEVNGKVMPVAVIGTSLAFLPINQFATIDENAQCPQDLPGPHPKVENWSDSASAVLLEGNFYEHRFLDGTRILQMGCRYLQEDGIERQTYIEIAQGIVRFYNVPVPPAGSQVKLILTPNGLVTRQYFTTLPEGHWVVHYSLLSSDGVGLPILLHENLKDEAKNTICVDGYVMTEKGLAVWQLDNYGCYTYKSDFGGNN